MCLRKIRTLTGGVTKLKKDGKYIAFFVLTHVDSDGSSFALQHQSFGYWVQKYFVSQLGHEPFWQNFGSDKA